MPNTFDPGKNNSASPASAISTRETTKRNQHADDHGPEVGHGPENHLALVYETTNEQLAAVVPFIRQGLERNERIMYIADENSEDDLISAFKGTGLDVESALDSGALTIHSVEDTYTQYDEFDADGMIEFLDETAREVVQNEGYERLRVTGEMTWALGEDTETLDRIREYERKLNEYYPEKPVIGLC
ncbi:MEDS domain-containing protein [Haladaptatus sp. NG-SE-30]